MAKSGRLRTGFNLGGEAAEADGLLDEAFIESNDYRVIASKDEHKCFLVGRTGAGKSAVLQRVEELYPHHVIRINPENLSLPYITNLQAIRYLDSLEINLDTFWQTLWRHVLLVEILKHRYNVDSQVAKSNVLSNLRAKFKNDRAKQAALAYLEEFEGRFWCEADERVRDITDRFTERIDAAASAGLDVPGAARASALCSRSDKQSDTGDESRRLSPHDRRDGYGAASRHMRAVRSCWCVQWDRAGSGRRDPRVERSQHRLVVPDADTKCAQPN
jgi:energy-coupling factor transporter ATP-binding protein EcfA2